MISNPVNCFISGSHAESFTYNGGDKLYHFSPFDNKLSDYMDCNIVLFANDEQHALSILRDMLQFVINCQAKYIQSAEQIKANHWMEFVSRAQESLKEASIYLDAIIGGKVVLSEAPKNQIYKIGWASNDTLFH